MLLHHTIYEHRKDYLKQRRNKPLQRWNSHLASYNSWFPFLIKDIHIFAKLSSMLKINPLALNVVNLILISNLFEEESLGSIVVSLI